jgi:hypothetical protein
MRILPDRRWIKFVARCAYVMGVIALVAIATSQRGRLTKLQADYAYVEPLCVSLMKENADLMWQAEAWEKEAVGLRAKYGEP